MEDVLLTDRERELIAFALRKTADRAPGNGPIIREMRTLANRVDPDPVARDQSKCVGADGVLRYSADGSEVFPGATGVRRSSVEARYLWEVGH